MKPGNQLLTSVLFWIIAFCLFGFFRFYGLDEAPEIQLNVDLVRFPWPILVVVGAITGLLYELIERRLRTRRFLQERPYWVTLAFKPLIYGFLALVITVIAGIVLNRFLYQKVNWQQVWEAATGKMFMVMLVFFLVTSFVISFLQIIRQYFGDRVLLNLVTGKYSRPFEEYRIFMFLDMRSSTTIAEDLGTIQYSRFVQDCFRDFTGVIEQHRPEVYQYVGDEVVLTWLPEVGLTNFNCIHTCYTFNTILQSRKEYYLQEYGVVPVFKAGAHIGRVRVAEIGVIRRDIAYHGDVMNTTARIQSQCNSLGYDLLISEALWKELPKRTKGLVFKPVADVTLKGKEFSVNLVGVETPGEFANADSGLS
ncbi:MAG: adenylate/guanylate cyclase domain-containing protein [Bacteroidota bacterium]